jgi:hypothetical protein
MSDYKFLKEKGKIKTPRRAINSTGATLKTGPSLHF